MTVVRHDAKPYLIEKRGDEVLIRFHVSRYGAFSFLCWILAALLTPLTWTIVHHADGMVISAVTGATVSFTAMFAFKAVPYLIQKELSIGPDLVFVRTKLFNFSFGTTEVFPLNVVSDMEADIREFHGMVVPWCSLRFWANGRSIELERAFPLTTFDPFVRELAELGVRFPITFEKS